MSVNISAPLTQLGVLFLPHKIQAVGGNAWDKRGGKEDGLKALRVGFRRYCP